MTISGRLYTISPGHEMVIPGKISKLPEMQGLGVIEAGDSQLKDSGGIVARMIWIRFGFTWSKSECLIQL